MFNPLKKTVTIETLAKVVIQYVIMQCKGILLEYLLTLGNLSVKNLCSVSSEMIFFIQRNV